MPPRVHAASSSRRQQIALEPQQAHASRLLAGEDGLDAHRLEAMTCRVSRRASRNCSTSTRSTRSPTSTPSSPASARRSRSASTRINESLHADRLQPRPLHRARGAAQPGCGDPRLPAGAARLHRRRADRLGRRPVFGSQVPAGQGHHRPLPRPRRTVGADRRWTAKVTDVRNWFLFSASERWREDGSEHEHYSDSGGKSGGQKEKLAYTILAASLAYQFGLEWGAVRSRSFRFVVIDEAFGRGSDESAQYGLQLFQQLNLQLLIVTPLQKIHIIEPFVASVGFVHNEDGRASKLRNLSIEEYRAPRRKDGRSCWSGAMSWTTPADLRGAGPTLWDRGDLLRAAGHRRTLFPLASAPDLKAPTSAELSDRFDAVRAWMPHASPTATARLRIEWRGAANHRVSRHATPARSRSGSTRSTMPWRSSARDARRRALRGAAGTDARRGSRHCWRWLAQAAAAGAGTGRPVAAPAGRRRLAAGPSAPGHLPAAGGHRPACTASSSRPIAACWRSCSTWPCRPRPSTRTASRDQRSSRAATAFWTSRCAFVSALLDPALPSLPGCRRLPDVTLDAASFAALDLPRRAGVHHRERDQFPGLPAGGSSHRRSSAPATVGTRWRAPRGCIAANSTTGATSTPTASPSSTSCAATFRTWRRSSWTARRCLPIARTGARSPSPRATTCRVSRPRRRPSMTTSDSIASSPGLRLEQERVGVRLVERAAAQ